MAKKNGRFVYSYTPGTKAKAMLRIMGYLDRQDRIRKRSDGYSIQKFLDRLVIESMKAMKLIIAAENEKRRIIMEQIEKLEREHELVGLEIQRIVRHQDHREVVLKAKKLKAEMDSDESIQQKLDNKELVTCVVEGYTKA